MHPVFFSLGPFAIHWYGVCMATGFLLFLWTWIYLSRGTRRDSNYLSNLLVVLILSALVGARTAYVVEHWAEYAASPLRAFNLREGGVMFYGGLFAALAALSIFARIHKERWFDFFDLIVTALPIGHAIGRIGCFLEGCCFGAVHEGFLGVRFPHGSHAWHKQFGEGLIQWFELPYCVYPTQLFESAANFLIFALLFWNYRRRRIEGEQVALYAALYAPVRFFIENFRADERLLIGPFSIGQTISLGIAAFALALTLFLRRHGRTVTKPAPQPVTTPPKNAPTRRQHRS